MTEATEQKLTSFIHVVEKNSLGATQESLGD